MYRVLPYALAVVLSAITANVYGFNAAGHRIIAEIAWQKLNADQREAIVEVLREHPRFDEDFDSKMPQQVRNQGNAAQNHWIFCQAAVWPDIARDQPIYHRARWHYINLPVFLSEEQAQSLGDNLPANVDFNLPSAGDVSLLNGVQAVKNSLNVVTNPSSSDAEKAIHYCWLIHIIPDLAQPLHSASLFSEELFPNGDKGGNSIKIRRAGTSGQGKSLHSVWDGILGKSDSFNTVLSRAGHIINDHSAEFNTPFVAMPTDVWSTESLPLAIQSAYGPILGEIQAAEEGGEELEVIDVPATYYESAGTVARRQAVFAGVRLAGVLTGTLPSAGGPTPFALASPGLRIPAAIASRRGAGVQKRATEVQSADASLAARMERLEETVAELKESLLNGSHVSRKPAKRQTDSNVSELADDDGEQCACGDEQQ